MGSKVVTPMTTRHEMTMKQLMMMVLGMTAFAACKAESVPELRDPVAVAAAPTDPLTLVAYRAPRDTIDRLRPVLQEVLGDKGRATQTPDGRLLIAAPSSVHDSLKVFFTEDALGNPTPRETMRVEYWVVSGRVGEKTPPIPELTEALASVERAQGYNAFTVLERASLSSLDGEFASASGSVFRKVQQRVSARGEEVEAHVELRVKPDREGPEFKLDTMLRVTPGQTVVLGQAGYTTSQPESLGKPTGPSALFYVVRVTPSRR